MQRVAIGHLQNKFCSLDPGKMDDRTVKKQMDSGPTGSGLRVSDGHYMVL
jgi:hypothetical protein